MLIISKEEVIKLKTTNLHLHAAKDKKQNKKMVDVENQIFPSLLYFLKQTRVNKKYKIRQ